MWCKAVCFCRVCIAKMTLALALLATVGVLAAMLATGGQAATTMGLKSGVVTRWRIPRFPPASSSTELHQFPPPGVVGCYVGV